MMETKIRSAYHEEPRTRQQPHDEPETKSADKPKESDEDERLRQKKKGNKMSKLKEASSGSAVTPAVVQPVLNSGGEVTRVLHQEHVAGGLRARHTPAQGETAQSKSEAYPPSNVIGQARARIYAVSDADILKSHNAIEAERAREAAYADRAERLRFQMADGPMGPLAGPMWPLAGPMGRLQFQMAAQSKMEALQLAAVSQQMAAQSKSEHYIPSNVDRTNLPPEARARIDAASDADICHQPTRASAERARLAAVSEGQMAALPQSLSGPSAAVSQPRVEENRLRQQREYTESLAAHELEFEQLMRQHNHTDRAFATSGSAARGMRTTAQHVRNTAQGVRVLHRAAVPSASAAVDEEANDPMWDILESKLGDLQPSAESRQRQASCLKELRNMAQQLGPRWEVKPFGSLANGFGTDASDLDVTLYEKGVDTPDGSTDQSASAALTLKEMICPLVEQHPNFVLEQAILAARIPILKLRFQQDLEVDLSCRNVRPLTNSELLKAYANIDNRVVHLGLAVKLWSKAAEICGAELGHLSSYSFALMCIYFMQVHQEVKLPCLPVDAFHSVGRSVMAKNSWQCSLKLRDLLPRFFEFYAKKFTWGSEVVSIRFGRQRKANEPDFCRLRGHWSSRLHIEDPYQLERNLHCVLGEKQEQKLKEAFRDACDTIASGEFPVGLRDIVSKESAKQVEEASTDNEGRPIWLTEVVQQLYEPPPQKEASTEEANDSIPVARYSVVEIETVLATDTQKIENVESIGNSITPIGVSDVASTSYGGSAPNSASEEDETGVESASLSVLPATPEIAAQEPEPRALLHEHQADPRPTEAIQPSSCEAPKDLSTTMNSQVAGDSFTARSEKHVTKDAPRWNRRFAAQHAAI